VPVLTTDSTLLADPVLRTIAAIGGEKGVPPFRAGRWEYPPPGDLQPPPPEGQRAIAGLPHPARAAHISLVLQNTVGDDVGQSVWDLYMLIRGLDQTVGFDFDLGYATAQGGAGGWSTALRLARPRLKMVSARDFIWSKDGGAWKMVPCPLGE